jgi:D-lyxose ketol-isomerase
MLTHQQFHTAQQRAAALIERAGIFITPAERGRIDVADFGLGALEREGVQILTCFATERIAAKVLVQFPGQTEPEHWHPPVGSDPGKEETIRAVYGTLYFYIPGPDTLRHGRIPPGKEAVFTCRHEIVLQPGDQLTLPPGTKHWFQAGEAGAVFYSFSTCVRDGLDGFTDPAVVRQTQIVE